MSRRTGPRNNSISLWDKVTISIYKFGRKSEFLTRVEDIKRDCYILEMPIRQTGELHLAKGDTVQVSYSKADATYAFKASILDLFEGDTKSLKVERRSITHRIQRRRYVRIDVSGKLVFRKLDIEDDAQKGLGPELNGILLNISAGGVLFESPIRVKSHGFIVMSFVLQGKQALSNILGIVKRCEGTKNRGYLLGVEFLTKNNYDDYGVSNLQEFLPPGTGTFDDNLQKLVIQFIYSQQVELRKKGLLGQ